MKETIHDLVQQKIQEVLRACGIVECGADKFMHGVCRYANLTVGWIADVFYHRRKIKPTDTTPTMLSCEDSTFHLINWTDRVVWGFSYCNQSAVAALSGQITRPLCRFCPRQPAKILRRKFHWSIS